MSLQHSQVEARSGREVTFSQIASEAVKFASALTRDGLRKGDIFAVCTPNCPEHVIVSLAAAACGATITTCNPLYTIGEWIPKGSQGLCLLT